MAAFEPMQSEPKRIAVPAWLLSAVVHLLALIVLTLLVHEVRPQGTEEEARSVGIVLAQPNAEQNVEYFAESDNAADAGQPASPASSAPPLPSDPAEIPIDKEIQLPGKHDASIGASLSDSLVAIPSLNPGNGRVGISPEEEAAILAEDAARPRKIGPTGSPARVGVFGAPGVSGHSFVFVIDRSKSMGVEGLGALGRAAQELYAALSKLEPRHKFQILAYNHKPMYVNKERKMLKATKENLHRIPPYFNNLVAFGRTDHQSALLAALRLSPDVVFLLTDGDPVLNEAQMTQIGRRAGGRTSIHCIQFGSGPLQEDDPFMQALARRNSGSFRYVDMTAGVRAP